MVLERPSRPRRLVDTSWSWYQCLLPRRVLGTCDDLAASGAYQLPHLLLVAAGSITYRPVAIAAVTGLPGVAWILIEVFPRRLAPFASKFASGLNTYSGRGLYCVATAAIQFDYDPNDFKRGQHRGGHTGVRARHMALYLSCAALLLVGLIQLIMGLLIRLPASRSMRSVRSPASSASEGSFSEKASVNNDLECASLPTSRGLGRSSGLAPQVRGSAVSSSRPSQWTSDSHTRRVVKHPDVVFHVGHNTSYSTVGLGQSPSSLLHTQPLPASPKHHQIYRSHADAESDSRLNLSSPTTHVLRGDASASPLISTSPQSFQSSWSSPAEGRALAAESKQHAKEDWRSPSSSSGEKPGSRFKGHYGNVSEPGSPRTAKRASDKTAYPPSTIGTRRRSVRRKRCESISSLTGSVRSLNIPTMGELELESESEADTGSNYSEAEMLQTETTKVEADAAKEQPYFHSSRERLVMIRNSLASQSDLHLSNDETPAKTLSRSPSATQLAGVANPDPCSSSQAGARQDKVAQWRKEVAPSARHRGYQAGPGEFIDVRLSSSGLFSGNFEDHLCQNAQRSSKGFVRLSSSGHDQDSARRSVPFGGPTGWSSRGVSQAKSPVLRSEARANSTERTPRRAHEMF